MQNYSNAESSQKNFLHYFCFALSDHLSLKVAMITNSMTTLDKFDCNYNDPFQDQFTVATINYTLPGLQISMRKCNIFEKNILTSPPNTIELPLIRIILKRRF